MISFRASLLPCAGKAGGSVPPLTAAGHLSVAVRCQTPSGSYRFHAAACSETPAQPYEEKALSRGLRAGVFRAQSEFKSPGGISPIFGELFVARRQVIGGAVATTVSSITGQIFRAIFRALGTRLSSLVNCVQQPASGFTDGLKTFLRCVALVHDESSSKRKHTSVVKE